MKKLCYSAFIGFWSSIVTMVGFHALADDQSKNGDHHTYTLAEVAEHHTAEDCWIAVEGEIYNISNYFPEHPTPPSVLLPWCGTEATEGMRTKGYGRDHSPAAWKLLSEYRIGSLSD